jgi:LuxR family maltose regulon positive regulatory protein
VAPLFGGRFDPPVHRTTDVDRTGVVDARAGGIDAPLVVIAAPAGYGKSTLVAQLDAADRVRTRMWHPIEVVDNDPVAFVARLLAGLDRLAPLSPEIRATVDKPAAPFDTALVPMLMNGT